MYHRNGKVVRVTALVFAGDVEACLQRLQWIPELSPWRPFRFSAYILHDYFTSTGAIRLSQCQWSNPEQGKSEGFESCDRPIVRKRPIWVKICDVLSRVTLEFDGWPWKTIGHLFFAVSSFVQHFIAIGEFKLELQSGNAQFGSNSTIFRAMWPWNLMDDLEKQQGTSSMLLQALCIIS